MRKSTMIALAAGLGLSAIQSLSAAAAIDYGGLKVVLTSRGEIFTDAQGRALYTYDGDLPGVSTCNDACARRWPPATAEAGAKPTGELSLVTRDDGTRQWADKGMPLYRFANDKTPGAVTGDNVNNAWHVAKPE